MFGTVLTNTNIYLTNKPSGLNGTPIENSKTSLWKQACAEEEGEA